MSYPAVTFRTELEPVTRKELDAFAAQLQGFLSSAGFLSDGTFDVNLQSAAVLNPVGMIVALIHNDIPDGWLLCDGGYYQKADYPALYAKLAATLPGLIISTTTFRTPNLTGQTLVGVDTSVGAIDAIGDTLGSLNHTHTGGAIGAGGDHSHGGATGAGGAHIHSVTPNAMANSYATDVGNTPAAPTAVNTDDPGTHTHSISASGTHTHTNADTGTGNGPMYAIHWIVKT